MHGAEDNSEMTAVGNEGRQNPTRTEGKNTKSASTAYLLCLLFGWAGIHHFYLRRYRQGVLWLTSFGGLFGIGLLTDIFSMKTYVNECNDSRKPNLKNTPRVLNNWLLVVGQVLFGAFYRGLIYYAIPWESFLLDYAALIIPLGTAFGTYIVSNVGRQKSPFYVSLIGAYFGEFLACEPHCIFTNPVLIAGIATVFPIRYGWEWRKEKEDMQHKTYLGLIAFCLFVGLCGSYVFFNASITTEDGEPVKVYNAFGKFSNSPVNTYELWKTGGIDAVWMEFVDSADLHGEYRAYSVLGLEPGTELEEVWKRYKDLVGDWDPDNPREEEVKAPEEFMRYNKAYKVLENVHKWRKYSDAE